MVSGVEGCWKMHSCCSEVGSEVTQLPQAALEGGHPRRMKLRPCPVDLAQGCCAYGSHGGAPPLV